MPLYEYTCSKCGKKFELLIRGDDIPICPHCQSKDLEKQWSVPAARMGNSPGGCNPNFAGG